MVQDTRKDPRAKVLTMTVRYKSATIDEFIEHHSHDVSRGGIFIKTPSPFPPGTLLKFEIRISEDKPVLGGVGRVVWKRDPPQAGNERPAGMGVKFLKIDDASRGVIDRIVTTKGDGPSEYDVGGGEGVEAGGAPSAQPATARAVPSRKATMLGLGAVSPTSEPPKAGPSTPPQPDKFFPETKSEADMPPPEERTVMRQAAELLAEALKGAGGSMEEIGAAPAKPEPEKAKEEPKPEAAAVKAEPAKEAEPDKAKEPEAKAEEKAEAKADEAAEKKEAEAEKPEAEAKGEAKDDDKAEAKEAKETSKDKEESKDEAEEKAKDEDKAEKKAAKVSKDDKDADEDRPRRKDREPKPAVRGESRTTPAVAAAADKEAGGSKMWLYAVLVIGGIGAIWYFNNDASQEPAAQPTPSATQAPIRPPVELPKMAVEAAAPIATLTPLEASVPEAAASAPAKASAAPEPPKPVETAAPKPPAPKPAETAAPKPPAPKPVVTAAPKPPAPKPAETAAPKPPAPKPKPTSDNPY
jgi:uncharacterized protein (TIGR02266 family)